MMIMIAAIIAVMVIIGGTIFTLMLIIAIISTEALVANACLSRAIGVRGQKSGKPWQSLILEFTF